MVYVVGFVCILVLLVYLASYSFVKYVFVRFNNGGDWNIEALSFFIGIPTIMFAFIGMLNIVMM